MISFSFPQYAPLEATIDDVIDRSIKHDDIYYYGSESRYFKALNTKKSSIRREFTESMTAVSQHANGRYVLHLKPTWEHIMTECRSSVMIFGILYADADGVPGFFRDIPRNIHSKEFL